MLEKLLLLLLALFLASCSSDDETKPVKGPAPAVQLDEPPPAFTPELRKELGAAAWVPADSMMFSSALRLGEQWAAVRDSVAVKILMELPTVQAALGELTTSEPWQQMMAMREQSPDASAGFELLEDAFSQEIFLCLDKRWQQFVEVMGVLYVKSQLAGISGMGEGEALLSVLDDAEALRLPGTLLGFRLADPKAATALMDRMVEQVGGQLPVVIQREEIGGGTFHVARLDASLFPPPLREKFRENLDMAGATPARIKQFDAFLDQLTVAIAIGLRDDYLMLSVGPDTAQLEALGDKNALADSDAFAPIRRVCKPGVLSVSYTAAPMATRRNTQVDDFASGADALLDEFAPMLPPGMEPRVRKDVAALLADVKSLLPDPQAELSISFRNRGIESYAFAGPYPGGMDSSKPLSILEQAGAAPLLVSAGRALSSRRAFERMSHWANVGYQYFLDYAVPAEGDPDRPEFEKFERTFIPLMKELHAATKEDMLPAVDAAQSMFVMDAGGRLPMIPGVPAELPRPLIYPRPAIVYELHDADKFKAAFTRYRAAVNGFLKAMAKQGPEFEGVQWPAPVEKDLAGGRLYTYPVPLPADFGVVPHAVVTKDRLVVSLSDTQSKAMLTGAKWDAGGVVDVRAPAGSIFYIDIAGMLGMLFDDMEIVMEVAVSMEEIDGGTAGMIRGHFPAARAVFGVFRSYTSRTWVENGTEINHSWLHMEDAKR